jgi:hypothetical protein
MPAPGGDGGNEDAHEFACSLPQPVGIEKQKWAVVPFDEARLLTSRSEFDFPGLECGDMSPLFKAPTCRRSPKLSACEDARPTKIETRPVVSSRSWIALAFKSPGVKSAVVQNA